MVLITVSGVAVGPDRPDRFVGRARDPRPSCPRAPPATVLGATTMTLGLTLVLGAWIVLGLLLQQRRRAQAALPHHVRVGRAAAHRPADLQPRPLQLRGRRNDGHPPHQPVRARSGRARRVDVPRAGESHVADDPVAVRTSVPAARERRGAALGRQRRHLDHAPAPVRGRGRRAHRGLAPPPRASRGQGPGPGDLARRVQPADPVPLHRRRPQRRADDRAHRRRPRGRHRRQPAAARRAHLHGRGHDQSARGDPGRVHPLRRGAQRSGRAAAADVRQARRRRCGARSSASRGRATSVGAGSARSASPARTACCSHRPRSSRTGSRHVVGHETRGAQPRAHRGRGRDGRRGRLPALARAEDRNRARVRHRARARRRARSGRAAVVRAVGPRPARGRRTPHRTRLRDLRVAGALAHGAAVGFVDARRRLDGGGRGAHRRRDRDRVASGTRRGSAPTSRSRSRNTAGAEGSRRAPTCCGSRCRARGRAVPSASDPPAV